MRSGCQIVMDDAVSCIPRLGRIGGLGDWGMYGVHIQGGSKGHRLVMWG